MPLDKKKFWASLKLQFKNMGDVTNKVLNDATAPIDKIEKKMKEMKLD